MGGGWVGGCGSKHGPGFESFKDIDNMICSEIPLVIILVYT